MYFPFLLTVAFIIRCADSFLPNFAIDMGTWQAWASLLSSHGLSGFFTLDVWNHYLPGYLYLLWILDHLKFLPLPLLIKLSTTLFDFGTAAIIYAILKKTSSKWAAPISLLYLFNPALIFNTNVWGQVDGVLTFFLLLTVLAATYWKKSLLTGFLFGISLLIKPQAIAIVPVLAIILNRQKSIRSIFGAPLVCIATFFVFSFPFFPHDPIFGPAELFLTMARDYPYTSLFAFNLWDVLGTWVRDSNQFLGLSLFAWGIIAYLVSLLFIFRLAKKGKPNTYLLAALFLFAFFLFPTRIHERYLFPFFAFLFLAAGLEKSLTLLSTAIGLSLIHFLNLYYVYMYYNPNWLEISPVKDLLAQAAPYLSGLSLGSFILLLNHELLEDRLRTALKRWPTKSVAVPTAKLSEVPWFIAHKKPLLLGIIIFAAVTRLIRLDIPNTHIFDEVYHAYTAQEILKGNKASWEWWNTPPKGFAYEWSHPPLAKEFMVVGLKIIGDKPLGWRIPGAILGTLSVILVYLIAWEIFRNQTISLLSAILFSLDLLPLAMSRIGMNDSYFLFFLLLAVWFLLREKYLSMGVAFGLSLASKWTAVYFLGLVVFVWLQKKLWQFPKKTILLAISCLIIVPAVYLFSYLPFFAWGHTPQKFIELQQQMWWYHTGLKASHPYESSWWSWPLMLRPVWLYVDYQSDTIANIYAMGNPVLYWVGFIAAVTALYTAVKTKDQRLKTVIFSYLLFFVPWALSPRIMFLYHYLPSIPFLAMIIAWFLLHLIKTGHQKVSYTLIFAILFSFIFFLPNVLAIPIPNDLDKIFFLLPSWK